MVVRVKAGGGCVLVQTRLQATHRFLGLRVHQSGLSTLGPTICVQVYPHRYYSTISHSI